MLFAYRRQITSAGPQPQVRILKHLLVGFGGADGGDDTFADAGDNGFLTGAADQAT